MADAANLLLRPVCRSPFAINGDVIPIVRRSPYFVFKFLKGVPESSKGLSVHYPSSRDSRLETVFRASAIPRVGLCTAQLF